MELWLSAAGLVVILGTPLLFAEGQADWWRITALTALGVGVLHGLIFWLVRRRQRQIRREAIREIRVMLSDIVNNQLAVILTSASQMPSRPEEQQLLAEIGTSIDTVSRLVQDLSEESLQAWQRRYAGSLRALQRQS